jgi:hypothetical protein
VRPGALRAALDPRPEDMRPKPAPRLVVTPRQRPGAPHDLARGGTAGQQVRRRWQHSGSSSRSSRRRRRERGSSQPATGERQSAGRPGRAAAVSRSPRRRQDSGEATYRYWEAVLESIQEAGAAGGHGHATFHKHSTFGVQLPVRRDGASHPAPLQRSEIGRPASASAPAPAPASASASASASSSASSSAARCGGVPPPPCRGG